MPSISDLWAQILAAPQDKTLQAQYFEALTQAGDWRADVLRLAAEIEAHQRDIDRWRQDFQIPAWRWPAEIIFIQDWPIELTIKARDFIAHAAEIVETMPLRHLNVKAVSEAPDVFHCPQLNQIASINGSHQGWSVEAITALANSENLRSLRWLDLSYTKITNAEVEILAASEKLRNLEHLDVGHNRCRNPVDAHSGFGSDWYGNIVLESIFLPKFGKELEKRNGRIHWLHALDNWLDQHPPSRYRF